MKTILLTAWLGLNTVAVLAQTSATPPTNHPTLTKAPARFQRPLFATNSVAERKQAMTNAIGISATAARSKRTIISSTVTERGAHHKVVRCVTAQTNLEGQLFYRTNSYTTLATGLNFQDGEWRESIEEFELLPNGAAAAVRGQHKLFLPADIYSGVIRAVTPSGEVLHSQPVGIGYFDGTNSVLIAELTNSIGQLLPKKNQVLYRNAFTIPADVLVTYRKSGYECDLVFRAQPPSIVTHKLRNIVA